MLITSTMAIVTSTACTSVVLERAGGLLHRTVSAITVLALFTLIAISAIAGLRYLAVELVRALESDHPKASVIITRTADIFKL